MLSKLLIFNCECYRVEWGADPSTGCFCVYYFLRQQMYQSNTGSIVLVNGMAIRCLPVSCVMNPDADSPISVRLICLFGNETVELEVNC